MFKHLLVIVVCTLLRSIPAWAEISPAASGSFISTKLYPADRYEIIAAAPFAVDNVFRFDRVCGGIDLLGQNLRGDAAWQPMDVPDLMPCVSDGRTHYQFFAAGQKDKVFILNTDNKATWQLDFSRMAWRKM